MSSDGQLPGFVDSTGQPLLKMPNAIGPGVNALIFDDRGRVLLEHRSDNGWWGLPGGAVEVGESVSEAVLREVEEETGLIVTIRRLVGIYSDPANYTITQYSDGNIVQWITSSFECERSHGELRVSDESTEVEYFAVDRIPRNTVPGHLMQVEDALEHRAVPFIR